MQAVGRILAVQEQRFRLQTRDGQVYLLTLARTAPLDSTDLCTYMQRRVPVLVQFQGEPNLTGATVQHVGPAD